MCIRDRTESPFPQSSSIDLCLRVPGMEVHAEGSVSYTHLDVYKRQATAALGAEIVIVGPASEERRLRAEQLAYEHGYVIVPPYNDEKIIAGQGTVGLEILEDFSRQDLPSVKTVLVPVGGGGLISGVSAAIKLTNPHIKVIGVEPELAADAQASLRAGRIVSFPCLLYTSLADKPPRS